MNEKISQVINCEVHDCKFCNCSSNICSLKTIIVSKCSDSEKKEATICDSYKRK